MPRAGFRSTCDCGGVDVATEAAINGFDSDLSRLIWHTKYRYAGSGDSNNAETTITDTCWRVASALAGIEQRDREAWAERFYRVLSTARFLPGGRILAGAGTPRRVTLFNCFVMGEIGDSIDGIFNHLKQAALTMQAGGGIGCDFSTLRPSGLPVAGGALAAGPVSFMRIWDATCATVMSTGWRRGAMMATLRCDHPDIEAFIEAKRQPGQLRHFNLSVQITDDFVAAVRAGRPWPLVFPTDSRHVHSTVDAADLWRRIVRAAYDCGEPGVLFVDRVNSENNLRYRERITTTNPCGEIPLPPYGACDLGSLNLAAFVRRPFSDNASLDWRGIGEVAAVAVRMLDNTIDLSHFPLAEQEVEARSTRRIGLGVTGLADALIMLKLHYDSDAARALATRLMCKLRNVAYQASIELAAEKGVFPFLELEPYLDGPFVRRLPAHLRDAVGRHGIRNSHLLAIAPAGTISLLAGGVSSGVEPVFDFRYTRTLASSPAARRQLEIVDPAYHLWRRSRDDLGTLPDFFVRAGELSPTAHLTMVAAIQPYVDNAVAKTINIPKDYPYEQFKSVYENAFDLGLKGCTAFRPNRITGDLLTPCSGILEGGIC